MTTKPVKKFTGKKVLMWFVGFFLVVFAANGIMAYIALGTWGGLETKDAYRKGITYNDVIAAAEEQKKSGWVISLVHSPKSMQGDRIGVTISWPKMDAAPTKVKAQVGRAVTDAYDQEITLIKSADNLYTAPIALPNAGQWNVTILVKRQEGPIYQLKDKFFISDK